MKSNPKVESLRNSPKSLINYPFHFVWQFLVFWFVANPVQPFDSVFYFVTFVKSFEAFIWFLFVSVLLQFFFNFTYCRQNSMFMPENLDDISDWLVGVKSVTTNRRLNEVVSVYEATVSKRSSLIFHLGFLTYFFLSLVFFIN